MTTAQTIISKLPPLRLQPRNWPLPFASGTTLTANGRTAIYLGLRTLGMPPGATILMPEWHCGSEVDAVIAAEGTPVLYRLDDALSADLDDISEKISTLKPWAVYCTHFLGYPQPLHALARLTQDTGTRLIEDLALGLLSSDASTGLGATGDMTIYSLVKTLPVADGGAMWLKDCSEPGGLTSPGLKANVKGARSLLRRRRPRKGTLNDRFANTPEAALDAWDPAAGFDGAAPLHAASALTRAVLPRLDFAAIKAHHRAQYAALWARLSEMEGACPLMPELPDGVCPAYFLVVVPDEARATAFLAAAGVESVRFWRRFHPKFGPDSSPRLTKLRRHVLRLPIHTGVTEADIDRMADALSHLPAAPRPV